MCCDNCFDCVTLRQDRCAYGVNMVMIIAPNTDSVTIDINPAFVHILCTAYCTHKVLLQTDGHTLYITHGIFAHLLKSYVTLYEVRPKFCRTSYNIGLPPKFKYYLLGNPYKKAVVRVTDPLLVSAVRPKIVYFKDCC